MTTPADGSYLDRLLGLVSGQDTLASLAESGERVGAVVRALGPARMGKAWAEGKWTGAQVLAHLADAELVMGYRARQTLTQQPFTVQEYDESAWLGLYGGVEVDAALDTFLAARRWNLALFRRLDDAQWQRVCRHPSRGEETLGTAIRALAGHTVNHLAQIEKLR